MNGRAVYSLNQEHATVKCIMIQPNVCSGHVSVQAGQPY